MRFTKMHGIGNDYVYVDCFAQSSPEDPSQLAQRIADRHFGVGGDGLVLMGSSNVADARMRMFNADGSESEMCGNAVRCVAKYVYDHGIAKKPTLKIETGRGVLTLDVVERFGKADRVRVDMDEPILAAGKIPVELKGFDGTQSIVNLPLTDYFALPPAEWHQACGLDFQMTCVSMGNPHLMLYCKNVSKVPLESIGPVLETAPIFPRRINVHFVEVHSPKEVTMRTWERGSGITLACGTGAAAVCVAGVLTGRGERKILAHLPGGDLELEYRESDNHVYKTGGATEVFTGEWPD
jgi:diaminopimelate epimerase